MEYIGVNEVSEADILRYSSKGERGKGRERSNMVTDFHDGFHAYI
jgi:hypothetical protein